MRYWDNDGAHQDKVEKLTELLPFFGPVANAKTTNKRLEKFRKAQNCYYDLYNNGLCNRAREFSNVFRISGVSKEIKQRYGYADLISKTTEAVIEAKFDEIILAAAKEQGVV